MIDKYTWVDIGSSYLPGELQAAYLFGQLEEAKNINDFRLGIWQRYNLAFAGLVAAGLLEVPTVPEACIANGHMFYIKVKNIDARKSVLSYLNAAGVGAVFHYVPLHSAPAGVLLGRFTGEDRFTTQESERLIRLPIWYGMAEPEMQHVINSVIGAVDAAGR